MKNELTADGKNSSDVLGDKNCNFNSDGADQEVYHSHGAEAASKDKSEDESDDGSEANVSDADGSELSGVSAKEKIISPTQGSCYPELDNLIYMESTLKAPDGDMREWIESEYRNARGHGLDTISPAILPQLWQHQSRNWLYLTSKYIKDIIYYVHDFVCKLIVHVCPDEHTRLSLQSMLTEALFE